MKHDSFEKMDESLMAGFKKIREQEIPENVLRGFSESVEKQVLKARGQTPPFVIGTAIFSVSALLIVGLLVWQWPYLAKITTQPNKTILLEREVDADIQALKALGEWTEEDEAALGIPVENAFAEFAEFDLDVDDDGLMLSRNMGISIH